MAKEEKTAATGTGDKRNIEDIQRHIDLLDDRLDNIDSIVTAVAERVMNQPITLNITCPHCGKNVEITIMGKGKPSI